MDKDYLSSQKLFLDDGDFDLQDINLTLNKSQCHENRFENIRNSSKIKENKSNYEIS